MYFDEAYTWTREYSTSTINNNLMVVQLTNTAAGKHPPPNKIRRESNLLLYLRVYSYNAYDNTLYVFIQAMM